MRKKVLAFMLAAMMTVGLTACGSRYGQSVRSIRAIRSGGFRQFRSGGCGGRGSLF